MALRPQIWHWRQDEQVKNFGDFLADFLTKEMFEPISWHDGPVHVIGSVVADFLVPETDIAPDGSPVPKVVFWGCGARDESGLSDDRLERATVLAVRGPLTASALKLGAAKPQGDIAFFLPALYEPRRSRITTGKTVCIPHFWDRRADVEFMNAGCDVILRTNISAGPVEIRRLIDSIASADFVLTASLHGAIVAAAYRVPFAFWDNGHIDLPFKWADLAAYLSIPADFYDNLADAQAAYQNTISTSLRIPSLWSFLAVAPFPIQPAAMAKIVRHIWKTATPENASEDIRELLEELERQAPEARRAATDFMTQNAILQQDLADSRQTADALKQDIIRLHELKDDIGGAAEERLATIREKEVHIADLEAKISALQSSEAEITARLETRLQDGKQMSDRIRLLESSEAEIGHRLGLREAELNDIREVRNAAAEAAEVAYAAETERRSRLQQELLDREAALEALIHDAEAEIETRDRAVKGNLERLLERSRSLSNGPSVLDEADFDTPSDMQALFLALGTSISELQEARHRDEHTILRQDQQVKLLTDDAGVAWQQTVDARESERAIMARLQIGQSRNEELESENSALKSAMDDLAGAVVERTTLQGLIAEQDRLLQSAAARLADLSRQVEIGAHESEQLHQRLKNTEAERQAAQRRYNKIASSRTWRWVRRSRKAREYFAPNRMKQRGRRLVRILTGRGRRKKQTIQAASPVAELTPVPHPAFVNDIAIFIVDLTGSPAPGAYDNVKRLAASGGQIIICGDVGKWAASGYLTVPSVAADLSNHIDHHLRTSSLRTTVIVFGADTVIDGDLNSFANVFRESPEAVVCSGIVVHDNKVVAAGGTFDENGAFAPAGAGMPVTDFRVSHVHEAPLAWPVVVAVDADGLRHLGGLNHEPSAEAALVSLSAEARRRGLDVVVNPFVRASAGIRNIVHVSAETLETARLTIRKLKPKVLFADAVTPTPDRDSGSIDIYWYMRIFQQLGYYVTFLPIHDLKHAGRYTDALRMAGIRCPLKDDISEAWTFLRDFGSEFELVMAYRASASCHIISPVREFAPQAKVVFDTVDLHFLREERAAHLSGSAEAFDQARRTRIEELKIMALSDATILLSSKEYEYIGEIAPDVRRYLISIVRPVPGLLAPIENRRGCLFVGGFKHAPNVDAAQFLCTDVWPRLRSRDPSAELFIVGADVTPEIQALHNPTEGIHIVGFVEDLAPYYKSMRVNLAPLRYGAGVKGKVVASLSVGLPTVATSAAAEGMFLTDGLDVLIREDPDAFAEAVFRLNHDNELWRSISTNAVKAAKSHYSIDAAQSRIVAMLEDLGLPTV